MPSVREMISSGSRRTGGQLRNNAIGLPAILCLLVTSAAPPYAMLLNAPVGVKGSGFGAPSGFIIAGIILIIFAVDYVAMAKRVAVAGGLDSLLRPSPPPHAC